MAERHLQVRVLLNKGKKGISLHRLPKLLGDIQKFLDSLSEDTVGKSGDWVGLNFRSTSSIEYTAESVEAVETERIADFDECLKGVIRSKPDPKLRRSTLLQYAKIAEPLGDETVSFGVGETIAPDASVSIEWLDVDKAAAASLASSGQSLVKSHGSVQGIMQSLFLETPHFYLKELSTGKRILCQYDKSRYEEIVDALERQQAVLHVEGIIWTDLVEREIKKIEVSHIAVAHSLAKSDLKRFIGSAPGGIDADALQAFIDESRDRGQA